MSDKKLGSTKELVDVLNSILGLLSKLGAFVGAGVILIYCIYIGFHPNGLSVGDALVFFFALFAFTVVDVLGLAYGAISTLLVLSIFFKIPKWLRFEAVHKFPPAPPEVEVLKSTHSRKVEGLFLWLTKRITWRPSREVRLKSFVTGWYLVTSFLLSFLYFGLLITAIMSENERGIQIAKLLAGFLCGGVIVALILAFETAPKPDDALKEDATRPEKDFLQHKLLLPLFVLVTPLVIGAPVFMLELSMSMIGLRAENAPVQVSDENFVKLKAIADRFEIPVLDCRVQNNERIVYGLDVLWHGIGETAYVRIVDRNKVAQGKHPYAEFELRDSGVSPIKTNQKLVPTPCFELKTDALFESHKWNLRAESEPVLEEFRQGLSKVGKVESIEVAGYSDPMLAVAPNNYELSELRANTIKEWMIDRKLVTRDQVVAHGFGPIKPIALCPLESSVEKQRLCNSPNRRVEVIVRLSQSMTK